MPRVAVVIPCHNHAQYVADAVSSALNQTHRDVVAIVVDDGSTDDPREALAGFANDTRLVMAEHPEPYGVSAARNLGIAVALDWGADHLQFLDADDTIAPRKLELQLAAFDESIGFVWSDVRIFEVRGTSELASERYSYAKRDLDGDLKPQLEVENFIPVHSPLVKLTPAARAIRFPEQEISREDWHYWYSLAASGAQARYLPNVLATYKKRPGGRNAKRPTRHKRPGAVDPLRLNLGCGNPKNRSWHPLPGLVNLDKSIGWCFEQGLRDFADQSVAGITISHALMYLPASAWPAFLAECRRVLEPGGVLRITEDDTANPESRTYPNGWHDVVTLTSPRQTLAALDAAGFATAIVDEDKTLYRDGSLRQSFHGPRPHVFYVEGVKR